MAIFDFEKGLKKTKDTLQGAVDSVKTAAKDARLPDVKAPNIEVPDIKAPDMKVVQAKMQQVRDAFKKKEKADSEDIEVSEKEKVSAYSAIKIVYYLMAADGRIFHGEEEKFEEIGTELDPKFSNYKEQILKECREQLDKVIDPEDYYDTLQDGIEDALLSFRTTADSLISPKLLVWDLLTIAYSDGNYDETERRILKYVVRKLNIDKAVFLELENSIVTLLDLEKELQWIKTTDRPYLTIEAMVNEITDRKKVISESVKDLIAL